MFTRQIEKLFYFLSKKFGTSITYYQSEKAPIDFDTGMRSNTDKPYTVKAVFAPVDNYVIFLHKLLGKTEMTKTQFLVLLSMMPVTPNLEYDYFKANNQTFRNLSLEKHGTIGILCGEAV